ncbi:vesicular-fusion protein SEC17 [Fomitiporia mediterranea MF3/22]|uniref:vesicular-fusion protein SEC17 n=1 Tax=Fomitiporia mediterranea (strain MF3/22) TaxID=694068 RepID=UPI000440891B|nr:vesicular-fusion protein SEC17 [Fomitiporia mediterranea MF3/22]EJD04098.1 vesicular-fusion protein SEC17 [Fomitiporia mediterranea MF3/22]
MAPQKSEAQNLLQKAEKKFNSSAGWFSSASTKYEEAGDYFQQAANAFKLERSFVDAGDAFAKEAECREKSGENNDAANAWWNAAKAYKQGDRPDLAIDALGQTVTYLTKSGRFRQAADREKDIAQIHLQRGDLARACQSYERAGEWYQQEDANAMANGCFKDAADLHAQIDEFAQAIARYEQVADQSLQSNLTKYSVKEYWLRSGLCALANMDSVTAKRNLDRYESLDPGFSTRLEGKFLRKLIEAVESADVQAFSTACKDYDEVMKLDAWKTAILLKVKKTIDEEPGLT